MTLRWIFGCPDENGFISRDTIEILSAVSPVLSLRLLTGTVNSCGE